LVKVKSFIPDFGDIVWLDFNPQAGHEQAGRQPALVISPKMYNEKTGLAIFCPVTSKMKGYPFEVKIQQNDKIEGVILSDQIKNLEWKTRNAEFITKLPETEFKETINKINALLNPAQWKG